MRPLQAHSEDRGPIETDFLVIGAGIAGLRAAIELAEAGRVLVLAKREVTESATHYTQGGIAAALSDEDEIRLHLHDTLSAGDGLCNLEAAEVLVEEGPGRIEELIAWGTKFDRRGTKLSFTREGAHSRSRILHAHGDSTGQEIARALCAKARMLPSLSIREFMFVTDLRVAEGRVRGATCIDQKGTTHNITAVSVLLASGGLGQVYRETTNPEVATGDGIAMAFRKGAILSDLEFVQFHPTVLYLKGAPRFLLSEALRGEGAYLRNMEMRRFMPKYSPDAELAARDVVARAIVHELEVSAAEDPAVYLDLTHLSCQRVRERFPRIHSTCLQYNVDITTDLVPVRPAAHYAMGGVRTDLHGRTSLAGLYAAGEVACTGVHGANRLASNSLLEGLVYGARVGLEMRREALVSPAVGIKPAQADRSTFHRPDTANLEHVICEARDLMWREVGVVRNGDGLRRAVRRLEELAGQLGNGNSRRWHEARNILATGLLIARLALAREESRGAHYRTDFPAHNDAGFQKHSLLSSTGIRFKLNPDVGDPDKQSRD